MREFLLYDKGETFTGSSPDREQAVTAAKLRAKRNGEPVDVLMVDDRIGSRRCRYWPDGRVDKLWRKEGDA